MIILKTRATTDVEREYIRRIWTVVRFFHLLDNKL